MAAVEQNDELGNDVASGQKSLQSKYIMILERHIDLLYHERKTKWQDKRDDSVPPLARIGYHPPSTAADVPVQKEPDSSGERKILYRQRRINEFEVEDIPYEPNAKPEPIKEETVAIVVLILKDGKGPSDVEITIRSPAVRAILQDKLKTYPQYHWDSPNLSITSPFVPWVQNWDVLEEASRADTEGARDLGLILDAAKKSYPLESYLKKRNPTAEEETKDELKEKAKEEVQEELISFDSLWTIFKPGDLIYAPNSFMKQRQVFILQEFFSNETRRKDSAAKAYCWAYDWDGVARTFNRVCVGLKIENFKNQRPITALPCYPMSYCKEKGKEIRDSLIERGKLFQGFCTSAPGKQLFEYDGLAYYRGTGVRGRGNQPNDSFNDADSLDRDIPSGSSRGNGRVLNVKGQVMVDFSSYSRHGPIERTTMGSLEMDHEARDNECHCDTCEDENGVRKNQRYYWDGVKEGAPFEDEQFLVCPPRVLGYHLRDKKWVELLVVDVREIKDKQISRAFDNLQLAAKQKELIRELVQSHTNDKTKDSKSIRGEMEDLMKGKGEGLVILLHGPPGVGKTLTAESVAQFTGKPLFSIGVGDVTTDPSLLEGRLEQLFELAAVWQAVMLFDEADVFLESRAATTDVARVGLVSVLLRVLEYYQGILILTTNRIRSFDIAVQSRINLAIRFTDLIEKQKKNIFTNLINQLDENFVHEKAKLIGFLDEEDATNQFSNLNGRQIRNIVFSAASLAGNRAYPDNVLKLHDVKRMLEETCSFQRHLHELTKASRSKAE